MGKKIEITGQRFGRLTVLREDGSTAKRAACWICVCACGAMVRTEGRLLRSGGKLSCGCLRDDLLRARSPSASGVIEAPRCEQCGSWSDRYLRRGLCVACYGRLPAGRARAAERAKAQRRERREGGACTACGGVRATGLLLCQLCSEKQQAKTRVYRDRIRDALFALYGGYVCSCCGETEPMFLSIDHINGGGGQERRQEGRGHYVALLRQGRRDDLRVLCHNCNRGCWLNGGECPHLRAR